FPVSSSTFNLGLVQKGSTGCTAGLAGMPRIGGTYINEYNRYSKLYTIFDVSNIEVGFSKLKL
ncbi:hypothetical protein BDR07DRAFT_1293408, partial [Suillus spraguei]